MILVLFVYAPNTIIRSTTVAAAAAAVHASELQSDYVI